MLEKSTEGEVKTDSTSPFLKSKKTQPARTEACIRNENSFRKEAHCPHLKPPACRPGFTLESKANGTQSARRAARSISKNATLVARSLAQAAEEASGPFVRSVRLPGKRMREGGGSGRSVRLPGPPSARPRTSKISRFMFLSRPSVSFSNFRSSKMSSQHTFGLSKFVCCDDISMMTSRRDNTQFHERPRKLEKMVGRRKKKREFLAPNPHPNRTHPDLCFFFLFFV